MVMDYENCFSLAQVVTASAASKNVIDLGAAGDAAKSELYLVVRNGTAAASEGGNATITIALQTDSVENFASATTLYTTAALDQDAASGDVELVKVRVPAGCERYLRVYYTIGTEDLTAGTFDAFLVETAHIQSFS